MKIKKRILSLALAGTMALGLMPGMNMTALAAEGDTRYTLTIPSTLNVANSGWNDTDGISATGSLASGKKLTVTASSDGEFAFVNQSDNTQKVGYKLATASTDTEATTSWTFDSLSDTATKKDMGIIVEDYSSKPAGTYTDTVTFTASVVSATKKLTIKGSYMDDYTSDIVTKSLEIEYNDNDTWKDIAERYDEVRLEDNDFGPSEGKIVIFWNDHCKLKSHESTYNYNLVSINDKVSTYSSYKLSN